MFDPKKQHDSKRPISAAPPAGRPAGALTTSQRRLWVGATLAGIVLRIVLLATFGGRLYPSDHYDFALWGVQSTDRGLLRIYDEAPPVHAWRTWQDRRWVVSERDRGAMRCLYPPLALYLLYGSGVVFQACSADRLINTPTSQLLFGVWSIAGDVLAAVGCGAIVALFRSGRASLITYLLVLFAPPLWWDSVVWGQTDSMLLAPAVWMLYAMLRQRWLTAGLLWGVALGLKPQAILFLPAWGWALVTGGPIWRVLVGGVVGGGVLLIVGLPFTLSGSWTWLRASYWDAFFAMFTQYTTLKAFNIWYLDALLSDSLDAQARFAGLTKDAWGRLFLLVGLTAGLTLAWWRWRREPRGIVLWTALSLLLFVMLPTKVHERYLLVALPFLGIACAWYTRYWPGFLLLLVVMMVQLTWPLWHRMPPGQWKGMEAQLLRNYVGTEAERSGSTAPPRPELQRVLAEQRARYDRARGHSLALEWTTTLLALLAVVLVLVASAVPLPAHSRDRPGSPRVGQRAKDIAVDRSVTAQRLIRR